MNKKQLILTLLFLTGNITLQATLTMGVEMTWPQSALLWVSNIPVTTLKGKTSWGNKYYLNNNGYAAGGVPQVEGYYATTNSFDIALQVGTRAQTSSINPARFNNSTPSGVANSILYFSDMVRACRNHPQGSFSGFGGWKTVISWPGGFPKGPTDAMGRGDNSSATFDSQVAWITGSWSMTFNVNQFMQFAKFNLFNNAPSLTLTAASFYPGAGQTFNGEAAGYYFAQTNVDVYLPLHMISPGDNLLKADPDYINFGPTPVPLTSPYRGNPNYGTLYPWSYGYQPANIPQQQVKTTDF